MKITAFDVYEKEGFVHYLANGVYFTENETSL